MAVRRCKKEDLRRIAKATGATLISSLANLEGDETFEASSLGSAEEVVQERISDDELILVKGTKVQNSSSIILRGANGELLLLRRGLRRAGLTCLAQTTCWTRWSARCTIRYARSSGRSRAVPSCLVEEPSRLR